MTTLPRRRRRLVRLASYAALGVGAASAVTALALRPAGPPHRSAASMAAPSLEAAARSAPPAAPPPTVAQPARFGVTAVEGEAERQHGGVRHLLAVGDVIERSDWITTGRTSSLRLGGAGGATIEVSTSTRLRLDESSAAGARLTLERGRLRAASPPGTALAVRAADGRAAVESADADFTMQAEPGAVRVVPHRNHVTLIARDERIDVPAGDGAVVAGDQAPVLAKVPRSLLLKVRWPEASARRDPLLRVEGETAPGSIVRGGGVEAIADARGRFLISLPLRDGENRPRLTSEDLAGRRVTSVGQPILVDRRRPAIEHEGVRYQP